MDCLKFDNWRSFCALSTFEGKFRDSNRRLLVVIVFKWHRLDLINIDVKTSQLTAKNQHLHGNRRMICLSSSLSRFDSKVNFKFPTGFFWFELWNPPRFQLLPTDFVANLSVPKLISLLSSIRRWLSIFSLASVCCCWNLLYPHIVLLLKRWSYQLLRVSNNYFYQLDYRVMKTRLKCSRVLLTTFDHDITHRVIPTNSNRQSRSCFNYYRIECIERIAFKGSFDIELQIKADLFGWKELRNSTSIEKHYQLICNSLSENFYRSRDIGGLSFISVIKTNRPFKLNIIFLRAWKKEEESEYES